MCELLPDILKYTFYCGMFAKWTQDLIELLISHSVLYTNKSFIKRQYHTKIIWSKMWPWFFSNYQSFFITLPESELLQEGKNVSALVPGGWEKNWCRFYGFTIRMGMSRVRGMKTRDKKNIWSLMHPMKTENGAAYQLNAR